MLLLYVDDLFLTEKRKSLKLQEGDLLLSSRLLEYNSLGLYVSVHNRNMNSYIGR